LGIKYFISRMKETYDIFVFLFRIVVQYILYFIYYISLVWFGMNGWWLRYLGRNFLYVSNFRRIVVNGFERFEELKDSNRKFLIVSNHTSLYDGFVFIAAFGDIGFVALRDGMMLLCGMYDINKRLNSVFVDKGKTTEQVIKHVNNRKKGDNPLVIFPDAMQPVPKGKNIAPFRTGAFVGKFDVLPVVIKYKNYKIDPTYRWYEGETSVMSMYKMFLDGSCDVCVEVLEPVSCGSLSIEEYKDKVYNIMDKAYSKL
jgi:1-acyl-sn-glycerol-3-phosphate acyltransferase